MLLQFGKSFGFCLLEQASPLHHFLYALLLEFLLMYTGQSLSGLHDSAFLPYLPSLSNCALFYNGSLILSFNFAILIPKTDKQTHRHTHSLSSIFQHVTEQALVLWVLLLSVAFLRTLKAQIFLLLIFPLEQISYVLSLFQDVIFSYVL